MKTIGLLGGMSWESSLEYYRLVNELVRARLGGSHSARCLLWSFDFAEIEALQQAGDWDEAAQRLVVAARSVERGGADCLVICTNTMHRMADEIQYNLRIPVLHIADATAQAVQAAGLTCIGLLGTRYTMEQDFYRGRLAHHFNLEVLIPDEPGRTAVHDIIYEELVRGIVSADSRERYRAVIAGLAAQGAQGVILGCTEITLLIKPEHSPIPVFDTTALHAAAAVDFALA
jgi:aspartate racemase